MAFTGNEDHSIDLTAASALTGKYRLTAGSGAILGGYFSKATVQAILDQEGCVGIKYYYGTSNDGKPQLVILGVDANGDDLQNGVLGNRSMPCPPYCGHSNALNS